MKKNRSYDIFLVGFAWIGLNTFILRMIALFDSNASKEFDPLFMAPTFKTVLINLLSCLLALVLHHIVFTKNNKADEE